MHRPIYAALLIGLACACSEPSRLVIDLRTNLAPGEEFANAEVELLGTGDVVVERVVSPRFEVGEDALSGVRVAELDGLEPGVYRARVALTDGVRGTVGEQLVSFELEPGTQIVTAVVTSLCADTMCPDGDRPELSACFAGQCADPRCRPEAADFCPEAECQADAECSDVEPTCGSPAVCLAGACVPAPGARCAPEALPPTVFRMEDYEGTPPPDTWDEVGAFSLPETPADRVQVLFLSGFFAGPAGFDRRAANHSEARLVIDGEEVAYANGVVRPDGGPWLAFTWVEAGPARDVSVEVRSSGAVRLSEVRVASLSVPSADFVGARTLGDVSVTAERSAVASLNVDLDGTVISLASAAATEVPADELTGEGGPSVRANVVVPMSHAWPTPAYANLREPLRSFAAVRGHVASSSAPLPLELQAWIGRSARVPPRPGTLRHPHLMAIRVPENVEVHTAIDVESRGTDGAGDVEVARLSVDRTPALVLSVVYLRGTDVAQQPLAVRFEGSEGPVTVMGHHVAGGTGIPYGRVEVFDTPGDMVVTLPPSELGLASETWDTAILAWAPSE